MLVAAAAAACQVAPVDRVVDPDESALRRLRDRVAPLPVLALKVRGAGAYSVQPVAAAAEVIGVALRVGTPSRHASEEYRVALLLERDRRAEFGQRAQLERHNNGLTTVIPVIVRASDWKNSPLGALRALPRDGRPISVWPKRDQAWLDVIHGLRQLVSSRG